VERVADCAGGEREAGARTPRCCRGLPAADRRRRQDPQDAQITNL